MKNKFNIFKAWWFWTILFIIVVAGSLCIFVSLHDFGDDDDEDYTSKSSYKEKKNDNNDVEEKKDNSSSKKEEYQPPKEEYQPPKPELTESEKMILAIGDLLKEGLAFDVGSYIKGDIPAGEYAFVKFEGSGSYYSEEDAAGEIVDNENFSSFGYVKVHAVGNLETKGVLISVSAFEKLGVKGAKEIYEKLNGVSDWDQAGFYKVGVDIEPGKYVVESIGSGYYSILSGPVGNNKIIDNDNFNGRASITLKKGQYLELSRATIRKA